MTREEFESLVAEVGFSPVPEKFLSKLKNVALLVEDEPDEETRREYDLHGEETLLGLYRGIPLSERGSEYGVGMTLPDTITIYYLPIVEESEGDPMQVRQVIEDTIRHEVAHYLGLDEGEVAEREAKKWQ